MGEGTQPDGRRDTAGLPGPPADPRAAAGSGSLVSPCSRRPWRCLGWPALLAGLVACRPACIGLLAIAAVQLALTLLDLPGWPCLVRRLTGFPCPGCGLSRACAALAQGDWLRAAELHAFAYALPPLALLLAGGALLPERTVSRLTAGLARWERRTGIVWLAVAAYVGYYLMRLCGCREHFLSLVAG